MTRTVPGMNSERHWPSVSLLMPNRDNAPVLGLVLQNLAAHTQYPDVELIVVDDGSSDGSREILGRWRAAKCFDGEVSIVDHEHTAGGVVDALNAGLAVASGELVVQLDADASIETPDWLRRMVSFFSSDPRIGAVTGRVVMDTGELQTCGLDVVSRAGCHERGCEITEQIGSRTSNHHVRRFYEAEWPACRELVEVDAGSGVCMMYRRDAALAIGGYDRGFAPVWLDDLDLTISLRRAGLKVFYLPDVRSVHYLHKRTRPDDQLLEPGRARTTARALRHTVGSVLPREVGGSVVRMLNWDRGPRSYRRGVSRHYRYWRKKWGWDLLNPDLEAVQQRWGTTEICWKSNQEMRRVGEQIINRATDPPAGGQCRASAPSQAE
jgi:GT2 family glycosyltransferase